MRKISFLSAWAVLAMLLSACGPDLRVTSPDKHLALTAGLTEDGQPWYRLDRDGETVIGQSPLGFLLGDGDFSRGFTLDGTERTTLDETWEQPWGEERLVRNHAHELLLHLSRTDGRRLDIRFRVFDDGLGFRYEFPQQEGLETFEILDELTGFSLPSDPQCWSYPDRGTSYYEGLYTREPVSAKDTVCTPVALEVSDNLYLSIHEANLADYASLRLASRGAAFTTALVPWKSGVKVYAAAPSVTPWRTVVVASRPGDLITSRLILNLNEPCRIDTSWLDTGRYIGIWWGMHLRDWTWIQGPHHGATTENTKRYIDFAAAHGFKGVLVEGWNKGWELDYGRYGYLFNFTEAYPDYDLEELCHYAADKGVRIIAHNETGGWAENYESQMDSAFALYHRLGINTVKTGYVNNYMDGKEHQHSQYGVRHYRKVLETAARYQIMIVNHEPAMPSGLRRTFPNMMAGEGMRGQEWNAWDEGGGNPPYHICVLPFTRGLAGPMDFTPGIFNFDYEVVPGTRPHTTLAKQLSEYVILYSPWQMAADLIENYEGQPAFRFIEQCPTDWERTLVPLAEIGRYIVTARQERGGEDWFVGAATDETARDLSLPLDFLTPGVPYRATLYADGPDADYRTRPYDLTISEIPVDASTVLDLHLAPSGGAAIRIERL